MDNKINTVTKFTNTIYTVTKFICNKIYTFLYSNNIDTYMIIIEVFSIPFSLINLKWSKIEHPLLQKNIYHVCSLAEPLFVYSTYPPVYMDIHHV